jgi:membrane-associated phospholipid phosphatase
MDPWILVLGFINLVLFFIGIIFFIPKEYKNFNLLKNLINLFPHILIIVAVVVFHIFEVNVIDRAITDWIGIDFTENIRGIEGDTVYWFSQNWNPFFVYFFVLIYIGIYTFTLWFSTFYFLITNDKKAIKTLAYGLLLIYIIALPFFLFLPITNVYTYYDSGSALEQVIPSIENFFYFTTTQNNCLPSLHTAMTILIAYSISLTKNKKLTYFVSIIMILVIISVIYLSIHWITDVIAGIILSVIVIFILRRIIEKKENNDK